MNLNHLQYFLETCRYGSITKASEVCHISQPSITAAINNLEKELGAKLFDRVNNRLRLTVVGEGFSDGGVPENLRRLLPKCVRYCQQQIHKNTGWYSAVPQHDHHQKAFSGIFGAASKYPVRNRRGRIDRRA